MEKAKTLVIGIRLALDFVTRIDALATAEHRTRSNMLRFLLEAGLQKYESVNAAKK